MVGPVISQAVSTDGSALTVTSVDVLLGRGKRFQYHPGNIQLRAMIEDKQTEYDSSDRLERRRMVKQIKKECSAKNIRFLKQNERKVWFLADPEEVDEKIRQHFRSGRKKR